MARIEVPSPVWAFVINSFKTISTVTKLPFPIISVDSTDRARRPLKYDPIYSNFAARSEKLAHALRRELVEAGHRGVHRVKNARRAGRRRHLIIPAPL